MKQLVWLWVIILGWLSGCALPVRTQGVAGPVTWTTAGLDLNSGSALDGTREHFSFTLWLQETQGVPVTLNTITWEVEQKGVDLSGRQMRQGSWHIPANGVLRQPFVYRIFCAPPHYCPESGPTTQWEIIFEGTDAQGRSVRFVMQPELPWIPRGSPNRPPNLNQAPSVDLPPIDFTVPRLYFPRIGSDG